MRLQFRDAEMRGLDADLLKGGMCQNMACLTYTVVTVRV